MNPSYMGLLAVLPLRVLRIVLPVAARTAAFALPSASAILTTTANPSRPFGQRLQQLGNPPRSGQGSLAY
jgi:hypothetical protein